MKLIPPAIINLCARYERDAFNASGMGRTDDGKQQQPAGSAPPGEPRPEPEFEYFPSSAVNDFQAIGRRLKELEKEKDVLRG